jgi:hypothetical protein
VVRQIGALLSELHVPCRADQRWPHARPEQQSMRRGASRETYPASGSLAGAR